MEEMDRLYDDDNKQDFGHLNLEESSLPEDELNQILEQVKIASKRQATIDKIKTLVSQGRKVLVWCLLLIRLIIFLQLLLLSAFAVQRFVEEMMYSSETIRSTILSTQARRC